MEFCTYGRHRPGYSLNIWHTSDQALVSHLGHSTRFRLILIEQGSGFWRLGERNQPFIAPTLFCLNEREVPQFEQSAQISAQAIFFHPNVINSVFSFEQLQDGGNGLSRSERHDTYWLRVFLNRDVNFYGQLPVGPETIYTMASLFGHLRNELDQQVDAYWPCRSRSYLIELLFLAARLYATSMSPSPLAHDQGLTQQLDNDIHDVILYLHNHYPERLTLQTLSRTFHTNRTTLTHRFRQATGTSVMAYLTQVRLRLATSMLADTSLSIYEIAQRVGFKDITHFNRTFRKHLTCSPSDYRAQYKIHPH